MLSIKEILENEKEYLVGLKNRKFDLNIFKQVVELGKKRSNAMKKLQSLESERNSLSKEIGRLKSEKKTVTSILKKLETLKKKIEKNKKNEKAINEKINSMLLTIPNIPFKEVPIGNENKNKIISKKHNLGKGMVKDVIPHYEIAKKLGIVDFKRAVKLSGSRFWSYIGEGAKLVRAIENYFLDYAIKNNYLELNLPLIVKSDSLFGTGQLPKFKEDLYKIENNDLYLIPTGEVSLTNFYADEILETEKQLVTFSPCFRSESGSGGKDMKGLIRSHQFNKVELVKIVKPNNSEKEFNKLLNDAKKLLEELKLPYQEVLLATEDLGFSSKKTIDLEIWLPSESRFRETSSISNFGDFQSRRAKIRIKDDGKISYAHTINGSALAIDRVIASILENYQNKDGSITIPKVLAPYFGGKKINAK